MDITREELLDRAEQRIASLVDDDPKCEPAVPHTMALLDQIVLDGQPTPQPTWYDNGVEISWLVNDWHVGFVIDPAGWYLWAERPGCTELFEATGEPGALLKPEELGWTQHLLKEMGDQIEGAGIWEA
jgi:hypothetical protein